MRIPRSSAWMYGPALATLCLTALLQPFRAACGAPPAGDLNSAHEASQTVYVGPSLGWAVYDGWETRSPTLLRKLARQALFIAARDELGLATRDFWLGSELPAAGGNSPFELIGASGDLGGLEVVRGFGGQQEVLLTLPLAVKQLEKDVPGFVSSMEAASRQNFVELLKKSGFHSARPHRPLPVATRTTPSQRPESKSGSAS